MDTPQTHPAFGQVTVHITHGAGQRCYGSDLEHHNTVRIQVKESRYERGLSNDNYHSGKTVMEVMFTTLQWAEFLTSIGNGSGTPCTIKYRADLGRTPDLPDLREPHHQVFRSEAKESIDRALASAREADELLSRLMGAGSVKKADLKEVQARLRKAQQDLSSNLPFVMEQFEEATERVVNDAKHEITAHFSRVTQDYGLRALAAQQETVQAPHFLPSSLEQV